MAKKPNIPQLRKAPKKVALPKIGVGRFTPPSDGKKLVIQVGIASATPQNLHPSFNKPDWHCIRVDSDARVSPDIIAAAHAMTAIPSESADAIFATQILQKYHDHQVIPVLAEMQRLLKDGGNLYLSVPDVQIAAAYVATNRLDDALYTPPAGPVTALDMLYGFRRGIESGNTALCHHTGFTAESLAMRAREAGFANIVMKRERFEIQMTATKYAYDNPQRVERIAINGSTDIKGVPIVPPVPAQAATNTAPTGYRTKPNMLFDEIDQPPFYWKDLGLKNKK